MIWPAASLTLGSAVRWELGRLCRHLAGLPVRHVRIRLMGGLQAGDGGGYVHCEYGLTVMVIWEKQGVTVSHKNSASPLSLG